MRISYNKIAVTPNWGSRQMSRVVSNRGVGFVFVSLHGPGEWLSPKISIWNSCPPVSLPVMDSLAMTFNAVVPTKFKSFSVTPVVHNHAR
jgi:hypothetical protein